MKTRKKKATKVARTQEDWRREAKEREEERKRHLAFIEEERERVRAFYHNEGTGRFDLNAPELLAALMEIFDITDSDSDVGYHTEQLYVKWTLEHFVGRKMANVKARVEEVYNKLFVKKHWKHGEEDNACYGWGDNYIWIIPHETKKLVVINTQSRNYLFILRRCEFGTGSITMHIRRFWDEFKRDDLWDVAEIEDIGITECIRQAGDLADRYSDHIGKDRLPGDEVKHNAYIRRPDLEWFRRRDFEPEYGDFRDSGYILSTDKWGGHEAPRVEGAISFFDSIGVALFYLNAFHSHLLEEEEE